MTAHPKLNPIRYRKYLDYLRTQPCIITGKRGEEIDPAHLGSLGRGIKRSDAEVLPLANWLHRHGHTHGEAAMWREFLPADVLMEALRCYAREQYRKWLASR